MATRRLLPLQSFLFGVFDKKLELPVLPDGVHAELQKKSSLGAFLLEEASPVNVIRQHPVVFLRDLYTEVDVMPRLF